MSTEDASNETYRSEQIQVPPIQPQCRPQQKIEADVVDQLLPLQLVQFSSVQLPILLRIYIYIIIQTSLFVLLAKHSHSSASVFFGGEIDILYTSP